jgi:hypothetical protein
VIVSLKVLAPAVLGVLTGFGLLVAGLIAKDPELRTAGLSVVGAALFQAGVGYRAPHVSVETQRLVRDRADRPS